MSLKKSVLAVAVASVLSAGASQAAVIDMNFDGLFTMLDPNGVKLQNTSYPYYGDATWAYGTRTQIVGTMQFNTETGYGTGTVEPFEFYNKGPAVASAVEFQSLGHDGLMIGNMGFSWNGSDISTQIVLDGSGLFGAMAGGLPPVGAVLNQASCAGLPCATPASDGAKNIIAVGPAPIATSAYNVVGATGTTTTLGQLSLGEIDFGGNGAAVGGTPMDNGPFSGFNANFDITSIEITAVDTGTAPVPVPAAVWLFGSGLVGLSVVALRRNA